ncbi:MAG: hypothetical protein JXQ93_03255 [Flavobacteriaceae bacterium]
MTVAYPVYRKADFLLPEDSLRKNEARKIANEVQTEWSSMLDLFVQKINNVAGVTNTSVLDTEETRLAEDGDTAYVVDNPTILAEWESFTFKIRTTIAVCYQESSTKNWTRVSIKDGISLNDPKLEDLKKKYDEIADLCCGINNDVFTKILAEKFNKAAESVGDFTIMTFGVRDEMLGKYLELFDDVDLKLTELFTDKKEAKKLIESYYKNLFKIKTKDFYTNDDNNYWIKSSSNILNEEDYLVNSNVLYNINVKDNGIFAFGLGADDSPEGSLANLSSLKLAKFYAKEI